MADVVCGVEVTVAHPRSLLPDRPAEQYLGMVVVLNLDATGH